MSEKPTIYTRIVVVTGGRDFDDSSVIDDALGKLNIGVLIHGHCRGADHLSAQWAMRNKIDTVACPPMWDAFGKDAGPRRNRLMCFLVKSLVRTWPGPAIATMVAFPGGKGTASAKRAALHEGIEIVEAVLPTAHS